MTRSADRTFVPPELRAVRLSTVVDLMTKEAGWLFGSNGYIVREVARVTVAPRTRCFTRTDHCLHPFDSVTFSDIRPVQREFVRHVSEWDESEVASKTASPSRTIRTPMSAGNSVPCIADVLELNTGSAFLIIDVPSAREFVLKLDSSMCEEDGQGGHLSAPVNMYKLCAEVVIPRTIVREQLCRITAGEEMQHLVSALSSEADMTLKHSTVLGGTEVCTGMTLHGRLAPSGFMRKPYWDACLRERSTWTSPRSRISDLAQVFLKGASELENKLQDTRKLEVGDFLVFRQGRSFAEICHRGLPADVYLSHFWGQPCAELLTILQQHSQGFRRTAMKGTDPSYWICTLANNQHRVDLGSTWKESPFYRGMQSLRETGGSVLMAMDLVASTLTRIWCIFEIYVCAELNLPLRLFSPDGDLSCCTGLRAKIIAKNITKLDFRRAEASVPADKAMILKAIEDLDGGLERVEWTVKHLVTDFESFLYAIQRAEHPITGEALSLSASGEDMMPCRIRTIWNSFFARGQVFGVEHISERLQAGDLFVLEGPGGSGKSVVTKLLAKHATGCGVLCLRVPVSQLAQVCHEARKTDDPDVEERLCQELLMLWAVKRFGEAAASLAQPKEPIILVLDGLDEARAELDSILTWLRFQVRHRKTLGVFRGFLITLRWAGRVACQAHLFSMGFTFLRIEPLSPEDVVSAARGTGQDWRVAVALSGMDLSAELWNRPLMSALFIDLVSTGVRLATIDEIGILRHFFEKLLPQVVEVFHAAFPMYDPLVDPFGGISHDQLRDTLMKLAWLKTVDGSRIVQEPDIHEAFDDGLSALRVELAAAFWQASKRGRIRLLDHGEGCVQFLHLRLQDYLAAEYLWYEGDCQALRLVSGAGYVGQAADDARFAGARSLLVKLLRDGAARPRTPDTDESWYLLCSAAMANSSEGARCALQLRQSPDAAWEVLGRSVFVPVRPRLGASAVLVGAMRWEDMLRLLNWYGIVGSGALGLGAAGGPCSVAALLLFLGWPNVPSWSHVLLVLSALLYVAWLGMLCQLIFLHVFRRGGRLWTLLLAFRFDWERHSMAIVGYGIVTLRADDVNLNLTLYMGYWKCLLVPFFWATRAQAVTPKVRVLDLLAYVLGLLAGTTFMAIQAAVAIICSFPAQLCWLYLLLPAHFLRSRVLFGCPCARGRPGLAAQLDPQVMGSRFSIEDTCSSCTRNESLRSLETEDVPKIGAKQVLQAGLDFLNGPPSPAESSGDAVLPTEPPPSFPAQRGDSKRLADAVATVDRRARFPAWLCRCLGF